MISQRILSMGLYSAIIWSLSQLAFAELPKLPESPEAIESIASYYTGSAVTVIAATDGKMDSITDAVCRAFKDSVKSPHTQATSARMVMRGATDPAKSSSIGAGPSTLAIVRGIETCLDEKLDYGVAMVVQEYINLQGQDFPPNYIAYNPPISGTNEIPGYETDVCVSNCI